MDVTEVKVLLANGDNGKVVKTVIAKFSPPSVRPSETSDAAVIVQLKNSPYTLAKLERHLDDDAKGRGYRSKDGYDYTARRESEALKMLADSDYRGFNQATAFLSGQTSYGRRVRAIEGIRQAAITSSQLRKLADELKNLKKS